MRTISQHTESPTNFFTPPYFKVKTIWTDVKGEFSLYLDIDKNDKLMNLFYSQEKGEGYWVPYLSYMAEELKGMSISEVEKWQAQELYKEYKKHTNDSPFIFAPINALRKALQEFKGEIPSFSHSRERPYENLICRCFGVYKNELENFINIKPDADLRDVTDEMLAGGGCTSCKIDILSILNSTRDQLGFSHNNSKFDKKGKYIRIQNMTPARFILKLNSLIQNWLEDQNVSNQYQVEIIELSGYTVRLSINPEENNKILLESLKEYLGSKLEVRLNLIL